MSKEKQENKSWFSRHKKLIIGGAVVVVVCAATGYVIYRNPNKAKALFSVSKEKLSELFIKKTQPTEVLVECTRIETETVETISEKIVEINTEIIKKRPYTSPVDPISVSGCLVKLPPNHHPSPEKVEIGRQMGMDFEALGITWRNPYVKGAA